MQFDWLTAFWFITQNFARYGIGGEISVTILVFILHYFQEKLITKFFKKIKKTPLLGLIRDLFAQIWAKMNFPGKRSLSDFKYSNYQPSCQKSEKTNVLFQRKMLNWWTDRQIDGNMIVIS